MGDFTNEDRNRLVETHTIVKALAKTVDDHETRIRQNEGVVTKVAFVASFVGAGITAGVSAMWRKIVH